MITQTSGSATLQTQVTGTPGLVRIVQTVTDIGQGIESEYTADLSFNPIEASELIHMLATAHMTALTYD